MLEQRSAGGVVALVAPSSWLRVAHGPRSTPAAQWAAHPGAVALLDGPMWGNRNVGGDTGRALFFVRDRAASVETVSQSASEGVTLAVDAGEVVARRGASAPESAPVAVQGWPPLVWAGVAVATNVGSNAERVQRAGLAVLRDGSLAFCASRASDVARFARDLVSLGALAAAYTDGGSSTYLGREGVALVSAPSPVVFTWLRFEPPGASGGGDELGGLVLAGLMLGALGAAAKAAAR